jgi:hypothetical protein
MHCKAWKLYTNAKAFFKNKRFFLLSPNMALGRY